QRFLVEAHSSASFFCAIIVELLVETLPASGGQDCGYVVLKFLYQKIYWFTFPVEAHRSASFFEQ
ncbi:hypothetical protein OA88_15885, partial [Flavobacterium sp. JRM]